MAAGDLEREFFGQAGVGRVAEDQRPAICDFAEVGVSLTFIRAAAEANLRTAINADERGNRDEMGTAIRRLLANTDAYKEGMIETSGLTVEERLRLRKYDKLGGGALDEGQRWDHLQLGRTVMRQPRLVRRGNERNVWEQEGDSGYRICKDVESLSLDDLVLGSRYLRDAEKNNWVNLRLKEQSGEPWTVIDERELLDLAAMARGRVVGRACNVELLPMSISLLKSK